MIQKTRGIVFRFTKYGETSIIVTIFTEAFGLQSYIVNGVRSKTAKNKIALYQPLTLLNLVVYHRENANIERIKEVQCASPYVSMATDIRKAAIAIFISEILNKTVKEQSQAETIFQFIFDSLVTFDSMTSGFESFHLVFLIKLSRYLGFGAHYTNEIVVGRIATSEIELLISKLLTSDYHAMPTMNNSERREIVDHLLHFYADHVETLGEIKSLQVLQEIFS